MSDSYSINGGKYAAPETWLDLLRGVGFKIEIPPKTHIDDLITEQEFTLKVNHPVFGTSDALALTISIDMQNAKDGLPAIKIDQYRDHFQELLKADALQVMLLDAAIKLGWAENGKQGVLSYLDLLEKKGADFANESTVDFWRSKTNPEIKQTVYIEEIGYTLMERLFTQCVIAALADATGGKPETISDTLKNSKKKNGTYLSKNDFPKLKEELIADYKAVASGNKAEQIEDEKHFYANPIFKTWDQLNPEAAPTAKQLEAKKKRRDKQTNFS